MRWEEALAAATQIERQGQLMAMASALSYRYLNGGPELLLSRERVLRRVISLIPEGEALPAELCRDILAWMQATHIAQRRSRWDLPPTWSRPELDPE
ncbi:MAG TPA: hypothetical protein VD789_09500 [Thermomicrobiales bacterium]|nr:hypothetical protein [Thermomicrobiales bacterium]